MRPQVGVPGAQDELLLAGSPGSGVGVLLTDVAFDGAELQGGEGAPADHAEHPMPGRVELHQVLGSPAFVVIAAVVPTRDTTPTRARCPSFAVIRAPPAPPLPPRARWGGWRGAGGQVMEWGGGGMEGFGGGTEGSWGSRVWGFLTCGMHVGGGGGGWRALGMGRGPKYEGFWVGGLGGILGVPNMGRFGGLQ